jgi:hypothetical protein
MSLALSGTPRVESGGRFSKALLSAPPMSRVGISSVSRAWFLGLTSGPCASVVSGREAGIGNLLRCAHVIRPNGRLAVHFTLRWLVARVPVPVMCA